MKSEEQQLKKSIADYLRLKKFIVINHRNVGIFKKDTNKYIPLPAGEIGVSDLICCSPGGRFVAIEVKQPGKKPTPAQIEFIEKINHAGGIGIIAYSIDEIMGKI